VEVVLRVWLHLNLLKIVAEVRVSIGKAVAEVYLIIVRLECVRKSERVIFLVREPITVDLVADVILVVTNFAADTVPAQVILLGHVLTVRKYSHPLVVETIRLSEINNIEPNFVALSRVGHPKKVPLGMPVRIYVILEHQIVFIIRDLHCDQ
jgi:hypothetical protein